MLNKANLRADGLARVSTYLSQHMLSMSLAVIYMHAHVKSQQGYSIARIREESRGKINRQDENSFGICMRKYKYVCFCTDRGREKGKEEKSEREREQENEREQAKESKKERENERERGRERGREREKKRRNR